MSTDVQSALASMNFGFLGSGKMAQAMVKGFLSSGVIEGSQVTMTDRFGMSFPDAEKFGVSYLQSNEPMVQKSDVIFACIKPNVILNVLHSLHDHLQNKLLVSIAAGITLDQLRSVVPDSTRIMRIMPNTPCLIGMGTAVYTMNDSVTKHDEKLIQNLCQSVFPVFESLPESLFNASIGVSGSAPAYIYMIAEAMIDGGVMMGLSRQLAQKLVVNTILGSAAMMQQTDKNPTELKNDVCSPGGTTIEGVFALEQGKLRATMMDTVRRVTERGIALSKQ